MAEHPFDRVVPSYSFQLNFELPTDIVNYSVFSYFLRLATFFSQWCFSFDDNITILPMMAIIIMMTTMITAG